MTIKEFAEKYDLPYSVAYEASYGVHAVSTRIRDRDFPEDEMFKSTERLIAKRAERYKKLLDRCVSAGENLKNKRKEVSA